MKYIFNLRNKKLHGAEGHVSMEAAALAPSCILSKSVVPKLLTDIIEN